MSLPTRPKTALRRVLGPAYVAAGSCGGRIRGSIEIGIARRQLTRLPRLTQPFFIIGIPGSLHIVDLCLHCVPSSTNIILVSNGLDGWEQEWAKDHLRVQSIITLKSKAEHGRVLDLLFDSLAVPFGILDYDCFVFNPSYFARMTCLAPQSLLNALFIYRNPNRDIVIPHTVFLFFNAQAVRMLRRKYRVSCRQVNYAQLSRRVRSRLSTIGIDEFHYPEGQKRYFDTFRLLVCLGYTEGYLCDFLEEFQAASAPGKDLFHVGGASHPNSSGDPWLLRGSYFWRRALEVHPDDELRRRYLERYGDTTAGQLLADNPGARELVGPGFFEFVERIVHRETPPYQHQ